MSDSFVRVEARVVDCFAYLVNASNPRIGEIISDRLSLHQTVGLIGALLTNRDDENAQKAFSSLSNEIQKAAATRNDIMHSSWATPSANGDIEWEIIQERARKRHMRPGGHALEDLLLRMEEVTFFIQDVEMKIIAFRRKHIDKKPTTF